MLSRLLKSVVAGAFVLGATLALALPTPKDIEAAVAAGHYSQAETMLREVLQDKPQSAKAHYELGQVLAHERRYKEAQTELQKAKDMDASLKFATSPDKFNTVLAKVSDLAAAPTSAVVMEPSVAPGTHMPAKAAPEAAASGSGFSLSYVWLVIAGLVVLGLWLRKSAANNANAANYAPVATPMGTPPAPRGFGAQFTPNAPQGGYAPQGYAQPNSGGSTMTGAVVGGLAGVAAEADVRMMELPVTGGVHLAAQGAERRNAFGCTDRIGQDFRNVQLLQAIIADLHQTLAQLLQGIHFFFGFGFAGPT